MLIVKGGKDTKKWAFYGDILRADSQLDFRDFGWAFFCIFAENFEI